MAIPNPSFPSPFEPDLITLASRFRKDIQQLVHETLHMQKHPNRIEDAAFIKGYAECILSLHQVSLETRNL